jgi:hypothetical protein
MGDAPFPKEAKQMERWLQILKPRKTLTAFMILKTAANSDLFNAKPETKNNCATRQSIITITVVVTTTVSMFCMLFLSLVSSDQLG